MLDPSLSSLRILHPSSHHSSHRRKRSSSEEPSLTPSQIEERASRKTILHRRVSFQSPTPIRASVYHQPDYSSPRRSSSPAKRVTFGLTDIEFEMLSPAMLKMSIKRSSMSNPVGQPYWPSGHGGGEGGSSSFPRIAEEVRRDSMPSPQYLTQRRGSATSNLSFPSDSEDIHSIVRNGILEESPSSSFGRQPSMGNKREFVPPSRTSISLDRSNSTKGRRGTIQMEGLCSMVRYLVY